MVKERERVHIRAAAEKPHSDRFVTCLQLHSFDSFQSCDPKSSLKSIFLFSGPRPQEKINKIEHRKSVSDKCEGHACKATTPQRR